MKKIKQGHTLWDVTIYRKYTGEGNNFNYAIGIWSLFVFKLKGKTATVRKSNASFLGAPNSVSFQSCHIDDLKLRTFKTKAQALKSVEFELSALEYFKIIDQ